MFVQRDRVGMQWATHLLFVFKKMTEEEKITARAGRQNSYEAYDAHPLCTRGNDRKRIRALLVKTQEVELEWTVQFLQALKRTT